MIPSTCPICRRATATAPYAPFCSKRCADVDLQRWFSGAYAIAAVEAEDGETEDGQAAEPGPQGGRGSGDPL